MEKLKRPALVCVYWVDAETGHGWESNRDIVATVPVVITVGFLVAESDECVVVASTVSKDALDNNARISIPVGMIQKMEEIDVQF